MQLAPLLLDAGYEVIRELGEGGMGVVYEALDTRKEARVALKVLRNPAGSALMRFKREFRALQDLHHPNLVSLGELIEAGGTWFFTMELVHGLDFRAYARPSRDRFDEARVRHTVAQVAAGLSALHAAGKVHRDVKPTNVLVEGNGRAVVLDLGLVALLEHDKELSGADVVGTALYMAPEQAASAPASPAADVYGLGVMLYEALTGVCPFVGPTLQVLLDKQRITPPAPSTQAEGVPVDSDTLCMEMLAFEPAQRPSAGEVARRIAAGPEAARAKRPTSQPSTPNMSSPFVGRAGELRALDEALATSSEHAVTVLVRGESGVGKSAVVRRFTQQASAGTGVVTLAGRCYERESVPYKAIDGVMDSLARYMLTLSPLDAAHLVPMRAELLPRIFPVLKRVQVLSSGRAPVIADPLELRNKLFAAVRELLSRLSARRRVILVIDDLQWADSDSLAMLAEILREPDPPRLLVVATWRGIHEHTGADPTPPPLPGDVRELEVRDLPAAEARELAEALLARAGVDVADAPSIASEAAGHPLFMDALVRHAMLDGGRESRERRGAPAPAARIEDALWSIVERLDADARRVLDLVVVGGVPLPQAVIARAAGMDLSALGRHLGFLRVANLVRTSGASGQHAIETYHDKIRATVMARSDAGVRAALHRQLADALLGEDDVDPELMSVHLAGAGDDTKSAEYAVLAAERAERAVAFERAVRLYRSALARMPAGDPAQRAIRIRLGEALANAGHGHEAAGTFLAATEGTTAAERLDLQKRAAEQYLRSGHVREGVARLREVLKALKIAYPRTRTHAFIAFLLHRLHIRLRGLGFKRRDLSQITRQQLALVDLYAFVTSNLGNVDSVVGMGFSARLTLLALRAGEPSRVARALATESAYLAFFGDRAAAKVDRLLARVDALRPEITDASKRGLLAGIDAMTNYLLGRFKVAREHTDQGERILMAANTGVAWEFSTTRIVAMWSMYYSGEAAQLAREVPARLREAIDRGDLYAATNSRLTVCNAAWLLRDAVADAEREAELGIKNWPGEGYQLQNYHHLIACAQRELYLGEGTAAYRRVMADWPQMKRALLLRIEFVHLEALSLRGRAAVAGGALSDARACARKLRGRHGAWALGMADAIDAGIAQVEGKTDAARAAASKARAAFEQHGMAMHAATAKHVLGQLGDAAAADAARAWMREQGIARPDRLVAMLMPGFRTTGKE